jgi:hypothetical protein
MKTKITLSFLFLSFTFFIFSTAQGQTTTYNGSAWDNGEPTLLTDVVFTGTYISLASLTAKSVTISNNAQVTIAPGHTLTIENNLTVTAGAKLTFENNASLIQNNPAAVNTGVINYKRDAKPMLLYDFSYWSSPVANQKLVDFSPLTSAGSYFSFNADAATNNWVNENKNNTMLPGIGYIARSPQNFSSTTRQVFNGEFIGVPHNGDYTVNLIEHDNSVLNYNFIGNPYPSAITIDGLFDGTSIGALYIWTHNTGITNNVFTTEDYAIRTWDIGTRANSGGETPNDFIAAGQGFFAASNANTTFTFTNTMRVSGNNDQFFRGTQSTQGKPLSYYFWLNLTNAGGAFKQLALGYQEKATNNFDFGVDAAAAAGTYISFYSLIGTSGYAIQGRAYPWVANDQIPLGYVSKLKDDFTITLDHNHSFFDNIDLFLYDNVVNKYHNLKSGPYTFSSEIGTFNNRFVIQYNDPTLGIEKYNPTNNSVLISHNNEVTQIVATSENIQSVAIYDIVGRLIYEKQNIQKNQFQVPALGVTNQTLIVKTTLVTNQSIVKKLVY